MLDFPSLLYEGLRILMFQLSGVYCRGVRVLIPREQHPTSHSEQSTWDLKPVLPREPNTP